MAKGDGGMRGNTRPAHGAYVCPGLRADLGGMDTMGEPSVFLNFKIRKAPQARVCSSMLVIKDFTSINMMLPKPIQSHRIQGTIVYFPSKTP